MGMLSRQLYRSRNNRIILGVAGGLSEFTGIDTSLLRLLWLGSIFFGGFGILLYLALAVIIPSSPEGYVVSPATRAERWRELRNRSGAVLGVMLVMFGLWMFLNNFNLIPSSLIWAWNTFWRLFWPMLFIGIGIVLVMGLAHPEQTFASLARFFRNRRTGQALARSRSDRVLAGVCGGIAQYLGVESNNIRLVWIIGSVATLGMGVLAYLVAVATLPLEGQAVISPLPREATGPRPAARRRHSVTIETPQDEQR